MRSKRGCHFFQNSTLHHLADLDLIVIDLPIDNPLQPLRPNLRPNLNHLRSPLKSKRLLTRQGLNLPTFLFYQGASVSFLETPVLDWSPTDAVSGSLTVDHLTLILHNYIFLRFTTSHNPFYYKTIYTYNNLKKAD